LKESFPVACTAAAEAASFFLLFTAHLLARRGTNLHSEGKMPSRQPAGRRRYGVFPQPVKPHRIQFIR
jgi:hypothetical protein